MSHIHKNKDLLHRVNKIKGQLNAIEEAIQQDTEGDSGEFLQLIAACRGAIDGLMAEVLEGHIRHHIVDEKKKLTSEQHRAMEEAIRVINRYLK